MKHKRKPVFDKILMVTLSMSKFRCENRLREGLTDQPLGIPDIYNTIQGTIQHISFEGITGNGW